MYSTKDASPKKRRWLKILAILLLVAGLAGLGAVVYVRQWYQGGLNPVSNSKELVVVSIPSGSSVKQIAAILKDKKVIRNAAAFERHVTNTEQGDLLKAGTYRLSPSMSAREIATILAEGRTATDLVTVLPGRRLDQIRADFLEAGFSAAEIDAALDPRQYKDHPALTDKPSAASLEGYLYPESFQKADGTTVKDIIRLSLDEMQKRLTPDIRADFARRGLSAHQGITLASIVEKEVNKSDERRIVAQVFHSRLKQGMPLGSDVTFFYAAATTKQRPTPELDSPYNTRKYTGLPPGPISNVTDVSLAAVASPADTDFLYFVSGDDGKTYFSKTVEEHERLAAEHCKELCKLPETAE